MRHTLTRLCCLCNFTAALHNDDDVDDDAYACHIRIYVNCRDACFVVVVNVKICMRQNAIKPSYYELIFVCCVLCDMCQYIKCNISHYMYFIAALCVRMRASSICRRT